MNHNKYLEEFLEFKKSLKSFQYTFGEKAINAYNFRLSLVRKYSWAIPDSQVIDIISQYGPIVELGAGTGYWASLLNEKNVDIICYDKHPPNLKENKYFEEKTELFHSVLIGSFEVLQYHSDRSLFLCWPPYDTSFAFDCLKSYNGNTLIYVGEGDGGCCGDDNFFEELKNNWKLVKVYTDLPRWEDIRDCLYIYIRKNETK